MVKERKQGPLDLSIVKELQLGSVEQAEGKTAFPSPVHAEFVRNSSWLTNGNHCPAARASPSV